MSSQQVHYELFSRRAANQGWSLQLASENRQKCLAAAEEMLTDGRAIGVKVTKETLNPETREFQTITILSKGVTEMVKSKVRREEDNAPLCVSPADLYSSHAREKIGRLLDGWLKRRKVTVFELLHRPDLVEQLDASGSELQHAVQKISIPEAQARGLSVHEVMRTFQGLIERAVERIVKDGRKKAFPDLNPANFGALLERHLEHPERSYVLGGGMAKYLGAAQSWNDKLKLLLDLADVTPETGKARGLAFYMLEQPLTEILGARGGLTEILGPELDLGASLGALVRLAAGDMVDLLARSDANVAKQIPPLKGQAPRLAKLLASDAFVPVRAALLRRVIEELRGPRRLRPSDPDGEILITRALAMVLTAASGKLIQIEQVTEAFSERSRTLVTADFVGLYLSQYDTAMSEAQALVRLADNVTGGANKREAARWIVSSVGALKFEREMRESHDSPTVKLPVLADLQKAVSRAGLSDRDRDDCVAKIGEIGGMIETDSRLVQLLSKAEAPPVQKLIHLLRMAIGETAPQGPCAARARIEAIKLLKSTDLRASLASSPEQFTKVRYLLGQAGMAA